MAKKKTRTKRKPGEVRCRARVDPNGTFNVSVPTRIGKMLEGGGDNGRIPVRVTIDGVPCYTLLRVEFVFDQWEAETRNTGFYFYLSTAIRKRLPVKSGQMLDLRFVREEHTIGRRGRLISKKALDAS